MSEHERREHTATEQHQNFGVKDASVHGRREYTEAELETIDLELQKREDIDAFLPLIVRSVEKDYEKSKDNGSEPVSNYMTLQVGGFLISGEVISCLEYHRLLTADATDQREELESDYENLNDPERRAIHLKNAYFFAGSFRPIPGQGEGLLWRAKLSSVDGFSLTQLKHKEKDEG